MKILIATDGSEFSRRAVEKACETVINPGSEIKILSVFEDLSNAATEPFTVSADFLREMDKSGREQATQAAAKTEEIIRGCFSNGNISMTKKIDKGAAAKEIVEEAEDWGADLIVVGSHGYGFWSRAFLGSVSQSVINHAPCSVLVVKNKEK